MPVLEFNTIVLLRVHVIGWHSACQIGTEYNALGTARNAPPRHHAIIPSARADVAKLADALDLGSSSRKGVKVQVLSSAPLNPGIGLSRLSPSHSVLSSPW